MKTPPKHATLLRVLGATFGLAVIVGGTVGVAILRAPGPVAGNSKNGVWLRGGLFVFISAHPKAELATMFPQLEAALLPRLTAWKTVICVLLIFGLTFIQWRGTQAGGRAQEIASAIQACGFTLFLPPARPEAAYARPRTQHAESDARRERPPTRHSSLPPFACADPPRPPGSGILSRYALTARSPLLGRSSRRRRPAG